jgi:hypothetical protein
LDRGIGLGGNVVLEMIKKVKMKAAQHVVFDNFFGSVSLPEELAEGNHCYLYSKRRPTVWCSH